MGFPVTDRRVVRGGTWNDTALNARAAYRNRNHPGNRNNNLGVRVVVGPPHIFASLLWRSASGMPGGCGERSHRRCRHGKRFRYWPPTMVCGPRRRV